MSTTYFCWLCQQACSARITQPHYETGRSVYFCSVEHEVSYIELRDL